MDGVVEELAVEVVGAVLDLLSVVMFSFFGFFLADYFDRARWTPFLESLYSEFDFLGESQVRPGFAAVQFSGELADFQIDTRNELRALSHALNSSMPGVEDQFVRTVNSLREARAREIALDPTRTETERAMKQIKDQLPAAIEKTISERRESRDRLTKAKLEWRRTNNLVLSLSIICLTIGSVAFLLARVA